MKVTNLLSAGILAVSLVSPMAMAETAPIVADAQRVEFEKIIHDYLVNHPDVLLEASQALQQKQQKDMLEHAKAAIKKHGDNLFKDNNVFAGNQKGNVTVIEFFDYFCGYCKKMHPILSELIQKNNNVRVVYKELPIFGETSELASKAALSAALQGKYTAMHEALFKLDKNADEKKIMEMAKTLGLNVNKLKTDMASPEVKKLLDENRKFAKQLKLMGTPAFIVASTPNGQYMSDREASFIPGATSEEALVKLISDAEKKIKES